MTYVDPDCTCPHRTSERPYEHAPDCPARNKQPSITCPRCGRTSYHPEDIRQGYCGACHWWTSDEQLGPLYDRVHPPEDEAREEIATALADPSLRTSNADEMAANLIWRLGKRGLGIMRLPREDE